MFFSVQVFGQNNILIKGKVTDAETGQPLPFTNVYVEGKFIGTTTDFNGEYKLEVNKRTDTLTASSLGYIVVKKPVSKEASQVINFELKQDRVTIDVVTVTAGENPADVMLRRIIRNKDKNNYTHLPNLSYEAYTKYEIDLSDFNAASIDQNKLLSKFPHLKDYLDTTTETGTSILPIFFVENLSDNYVKQNPYQVHEVIKGVKMSGVQKQDFITQLLSNVNQNLNIYENLMGVMGKSLVSPIADYGLNVYKYNLNIYDTLFIEGEPHLEMTFKPKHKDDYAFKGKMVINLKTFAIRSIDMSVNEDINMGFVKDLDFSEEFEKTPYKNADTIATAWLPKKENLKLKFNYNFGGQSKMIGRKTKSYRNYNIGSPAVDTSMSKFESTTIEDSAYNRSEAYWDSSRHESLKASEKGIYDMVDSLKRTTRFKIIWYTLQTFASGYARVGPVSFGHIASIISSNDVENVRLKMGIRTNEHFSRRVQLDAYVAYGFKDNRVKYGGKVLFIASRRPWNKITLSARTDVDVKSQHAEEFDQDNVFTLVSKSVVNSAAKQHFYNIDEYKLDYESELHRDLMMNLTVQHRRIKPYITPTYNFSYVDENGRTRNDLIASDISIGFKWQYRTVPLPGIFNRETQATKFFNQFRKKNEFPIVRAIYTLGLKNVVGSDFAYHGLALGLQGDVQITARLSMYYNIWAGQIWGTVPYLLLKVPEGNFSFVHNKYFFNNMSLLEFAADRYASLNYQFHLGGLIFDKIPGIKKLKWREVITANVFWGDMTQKNQDLNFRNYPANNRPFSIAAPVPYVEAGFGIENIFKIIRIDSIWRITHRRDKLILNWSPYLSLFIKV